MEEILASIRRIISEDEAPAEGAAAPAPEPEPEPAAASEAPVHVDDQIAAIRAAAGVAAEEEDDGRRSAPRASSTRGLAGFFTALRVLAA